MEQPMKLKRARRAAGLSQTELAAEVTRRGYPLSQSMVSYYEARGVTSERAAEIMSVVLGVKIVGRPAPAIRRAIRLLRNEGYTVEGPK